MATSYMNKLMCKYMQQQVELLCENVFMQRSHIVRCCCSRGPAAMALEVCRLGFIGISYGAKEVPETTSASTQYCIYARL